MVEMHFLVFKKSFCYFFLCEVSTLISLSLYQAGINFGIYAQHLSVKVWPFSKADIVMEPNLLQAQVNLKIKQAFCPPKIVEGNPCLEYIKYIVFPWFDRFEVVRKENNGGNK